MTYYNRTNYNIIDDGNTKTFQTKYQNNILLLQYNAITLLLSQSK